VEGEQGVAKVLYWKGTAIAGGPNNIEENPISKILKSLGKLYLKTIGTGTERGWGDSTGRD